ncbi:hypothetical protein [Helicobacter suis]|uniref:hypothetical protein n=1 Tax=Helicobacter suis TaxID=104628 RepID=UPI001596FD00|nr:hypothetical protein [Helicobacter suis]
MSIKFNGVPSEIQLHTEKSWDIKKQIDSIYPILPPPLTPQPQPQQPLNPPN